MKKVKEIGHRDLWVKRSYFYILCSAVFSYLSDSCVPNLITVLCHAEKKDPMHKLWHKGPQTSKRCWNSSSVAPQPPHPSLLYFPVQSTATEFPHPLNSIHCNTMNLHRKRMDRVEVSWASRQTGHSAWPHINGDERSSASHSTRVEIKQKEHSAMQTISSDMRLSLLALPSSSSSCHLSQVIYKQEWAVRIKLGRKVPRGRKCQMQLENHDVNYISNFFFKKKSKQMRDHALILQLIASNKQGPQPPKYRYLAWIHITMKDVSP